MGEETGGVTGKVALGRRLVLVLTKNKLSGKTTTTKVKIPREIFCFFVTSNSV